MYGQMTAGSWCYIGTQGIIQGTYETFAACARKHFKSTLKGKIVLTGGLGGMGGAQPLAVTMNQGVCLAVECDEKRIDRRINAGFCDKKIKDIDEALELVTQAKKEKTPLSSWSARELRNDSATTCKGRIQTGYRHRSNLRAR